METPISYKHYPRQSLYYRFSILTSANTPSFTHWAHRRCSWNPKPVILCCATPPSPYPGASIYGGWEELEFLEEAGEWGMLEPFRNFVISIGIDDRKHGLPFLLGFFAAFALFRVRFSTITFLPLSLLVFLGGFTMGATQTGFACKILGRNGHSLGVFEEKLKYLENLFRDVDGKLSYFSKELESGIDADELEMGVRESYLQIVEHVKATIVETQKALTDSFPDDLRHFRANFDFGEKKANQKSSRKRLELRTSGIDFFQFLTGIIIEPLIGSKKVKLKDNNKEKLGQQLNAVDETAPFFISDREIVVENKFAGSNRSPFCSFNPDNSKVEESGTPSDNQGRIEREVPKNDVITNHSPVLNSAKYKFRSGNLGSDMLSFREEIDNKSSSFQFMTRRGSFKKVIFEQKYKNGALNSCFHDSADNSNAQKQTKNIAYLRKSESSFLGHSLDIKNSAQEHSLRRESSGSSELYDKQIYDFAEANATLVNHPRLSNQGSKLPCSSNKSIDEKFEQNINEAMNLLKRAREFMMTQAGEEEADAILYKAAELLSSAVVLRPMSLIAVGQLGNIYLLHGELKLKITRELRTLLLRSDPLFNGTSGCVQFKKFDNIIASREDVASVLVSVCEECEGLLVEAGRKYRIALSIDKNDVRALYNWGIALSVRAQLIADVGPETAMDADKIYLAAIDKFNALMSGSNAFALDALYRWGMVLRQRSHLRPKHSREKEMLLHQAKSLFEDALSMESENKLVRDALVSCTAELNFNSFL